ncbi:hypothetical protein [Archaeoglobus neptunius]|uniref:hypothetical protein n=1 Tax=Archaeoglobus neptunius TaxID=2798580 RepID=UPI001929567E|nr:hypothetical protein [Archaeoglobus neptunius]
MEVDQAAIDEILASAEADTPESRIDKLEKELDVLKGSVKKLLLDLRETLNNIENPFQNLQNLAEGALPTMHQPPVQQVQVIPAQIPEPPHEEKAEQEENEGVEGVVEEEDFDKSVEVMPEEEGDIVAEQVYSVKEKAQPLGEKAVAKREMVFTKYDIVTLFNLMQWVKGMLEKYTVDSLRLMLEIFESAGYISEESRDFVTKVAELIALNDGFEDIILELYRLHKLMNPEDTSMDSKLLSLILDKRL